jgi:hypothetical protein
MLAGQLGGGIGPRGWGSIPSCLDSSGASPKALLEAANRRRRAPACGAASSTLSAVVRPLVCDGKGSPTGRGTLGIAAWWKT